MMLEDIEETSEGARLTLRLNMRNGLHARPAAALAKEARNYISNIRIVTDMGEADAKSMLDVLSLALPEGSLFTLEASGEDASQAISGIVNFLEQATE